MRLLSVLLFLLTFGIALFFGACKGNSESSSSSSVALLALANHLENDPIADAANSGLDATAESMETLTTEGAIVANRIPVHSSRKKSLAMKLMDAIFPSLEAMNLYTSCWGGGNFTRTVTSGSDFFDGSPSSSFSVTNAFHSCRFLPVGRSYHDGETQIYWSNISGSSPYIQASTQLKIAPSRSVSNSRRFYKTFSIVGNGSVIPSPGDQNVGISVTWTSVSSSGSSYNLSLDETREVKDGSGNAIVRHIVSTSSPLTVTMDKNAGTRTINGTVQINHDIAGFVVTMVYNNATWDYTNCLPVSGNISLTITGTRVATGSITLSPGSLSYEYSGPKRSGSGTIDSAGCQ